MTTKIFKLKERDSRNHTSHGKVKFLHDVKFVPNFAHNLLSVGQLIASGYLVLFDDRVCTIKDKKIGSNNGQCSHEQKSKVSAWNFRCEKFCFGDWCAKWFQTMALTVWPS